MPRTRADTRAGEMACLRHERQQPLKPTNEERSQLAADMGKLNAESRMGKPAEAQKSKYVATEGEPTVNKP